MIRKGTVIISVDDSSDINVSPLEPGLKIFALSGGNNIVAVLYKEIPQIA